jgi:hypothetical protein
MKNKILLSLLSAIGLMAVHSNAANFVEVANLGSSLVDPVSAGSVNATVIIVDQRWTRDKVYILTKNTIIKAGVTVTVEPGTLIRCEFPTVNSASGLVPSDPGALLAHRGARLIMNGTADAPIIMTTMDDNRVPGGNDTIPAVENLNITSSTLSEGNQKTYKAYTVAGNVTAGSVGSGTYTLKDGLAVSNNRSYSTDPAVTGNVFSLDAKYGGIVMVGRANLSAQMGNTSLINNARTAKQADGTGGGSTTPGYTGASGTEQIEGMAGFTGYTWYGGDDDLDDSGVVRFVQTRYGGYIIFSDKELNGFTWCATGQRTLGEFIESFSNADDDNEFFGGCVGIKYAIGAYSGDDGFDVDQGYCGVNQFLLQLQNSVDVAGNSTLFSPASSGKGASGKRVENAGDHLCENDGPENVNYTAGPGAPLSVFTHANYTGIGRGYGPSGWVRPLGDVAGIPLNGPNFRDNASGKIWNALFMDIPHAGPTFAPQSDTSDVTTNQTDTIWHLQNVRSSGGYDNSGLADDLVTAATTPSEADLLIRNSAWFRCGLAQTITTNGATDSSGFTGGKYATRTAFDIARNTNNANYEANWWVASRANLCPVFTTSNKERQQKSGVSIQMNKNSASGSIVSTNTSFNTAGATTDTATGNSFNLDPGYVVPIDNRTAQGCLDLRLGNNPLASGGARTTTVTLPTRGNLNPDANFIGAFRDNNWARNWTMLERAGVFATDSAQIAPQITVGVIGSNPTLTFATVNGVKYSIEASVDNRHYRPLATVTGDGRSQTYQVTTGLNASATQNAPYSSSDIVNVPFDTGKRTTSANTFAAIPATIGSTPLFFRVMAF